MKVQLHVQNQRLEESIEQLDTARSAVQKIYCLESSHTDCVHIN